MQSVAVVLNRVWVERIKLQIIVYIVLLNFSVFTTNKINNFEKRKLNNENSFVIIFAWFKFSETHVS